MKQCHACGQMLAQHIATCPVCGNSVVAGITGVDDFRLEKILHEGRSSLVFRARQDGYAKPVTIHLFSQESGVDETVAQRLEAELQTLKQLPPDLFVQHFAIRRSASGLWYRVSEWVDADDWGSIFLSGQLLDQRDLAVLFRNIAAALEELQDRGHFMPYLILDDILIPKDSPRHLAVKINFKLSRFLNPNASHHGPMLTKLLSLHPDIVNQRPVDQRTGIWSLGKVFTELLTQDPNLTRFASRLDQLAGLDPELSKLIKVMLSQDPDLRPRSLATVVKTLDRILETLPPGPLGAAAKPKPSPGTGKPLGLGKAAVSLLALCMVLAAGLYAYKVLDPGKDRLSGFMETYARSIGFVVVEYSLRAGEEVLYRNQVEGSAFLADPDGYLLTNRHVACPWLEDPALFRAMNKAEDQAVTFEHRMFLWFEGDRAFHRIPGLENSRELEDRYILANAYASGGRGNLRVAGVPRDRQGSRGQDFFKFDFAVLKIDGLPQGARPLPLETDTAGLRRLSSVVIMGFPLGSQTQEERINTSLTQGHVRRTETDLIQVDSSIYKGNSGGPAVSEAGKVIGIASGVITEKTLGQLPMYTPLSDFGLVLPIREPARFIQSLKAGDPKWTGELDFSVAEKVDQVVTLAVDESFARADDLARSFLTPGADPALVFMAGLTAFCRNDLEASQRLFTGLAAMEEDPASALFMLFLMDWLKGEKQTRSLTRPLFAMDWQHPDEFTGYLAKVLEKGERMAPGFLDYENAAELAWRKFIEALILEKQGQQTQAAALFQEVVLTAGANDQLFLMALARFRALTPKVGRTDRDGTQDADPFSKEAMDSREAAKEAHQNALILIRAIESPKTEHEEKTRAAALLLELSPENRTVFGHMAFFHAQASEWEAALAYMADYFKTPSRQTRLSLGLGLLKGQVLALAGQEEAAHTVLEAFAAKTQAPWYRAVAGALLATSSIDAKEQALAAKAAGSPVRGLILHTALGLAAEKEGNRESAARHFREALNSFQDDWNEYDLARARLLVLRGGSGG